MHEWQHIENAPQGVSLLLFELCQVFDPAKQDFFELPRIVVGAWHPGKRIGRWKDGGGRVVEPTHWMALPDPPVYP